MLASTTILLPALFLFATVQDQAKPAAPDRFVLVAGEHDLLQVIDASARFLGRNYLLAPGEVGGNKPVVTLQKKLELDAAGCEAVVSQLAYVHGLVATPLDRERGVWEWINTHGAKRGELSTRATVVTPDQARKLQQVKVFVTTTVALQHANPNIVAQTLRPFFAAGGGPLLNLGVSGNAVVVQGMADAVVQAIDILATSDIPQQPLKVENDRLSSLEARIQALEEAVKRIAGDKSK